MEHFRTEPAGTPIVVFGNEVYLPHPSLLLIESHRRSIGRDERGRTTATERAAMLSELGIQGGKADLCRRLWIAADDEEQEYLAEKREKQRREMEERRRSR